MAPDEVPVFEIARGDDVDLAVALRSDWAAEYGRVQVVFEDWDVCGWHAMLESAEGDAVLSFPWSDHVDRMLRGEIPSELPDPGLPDGGWDDLEQGWWAAVRVVGDAMFIAETDFDELIGVPGSPVARLAHPGRVELSGVPVRWSCVPRAAWDAAWSAARASCQQGAPAPARAPRRFATVLVRCRWEGPAVHRDEVRGADLTEAVLVQAVESLNGAELNDLYLEGPGEAHMAVAGGPDRFVVYATRDNDVFSTLCRPGEAPAGTVEVVAGGQAGDYPARRVVDRSTATAAAVHWMRHGEPGPALAWERS